MPYFYRNDSTGPNVNLLFIHIPKTGGTSLEYYFSRYYNIPLNYYSLYSLQKTIDDSSSPQHYTMRTIWNRRKELRLCEDNLRVVTIVRNPYSRMISELLFQNIINSSTPAPEVAQSMHKYLQNKANIYDNHRLPQIDFLIDSSDKIRKGVEILHLESIHQDLARIGFHDFHNHNNSKAKFNYNRYMNDDSYQLINDYYRQDFSIFRYKMIHPLGNTSTHSSSTAATTAASSSHRRLLIANHHDLYMYDDRRYILYICLLGLLFVTSTCIVAILKIKK